MKIKNKLLLGLLVAFSSCATSFAQDVESGSMPVTSDLKVKLSGYGSFQAGFRNQNH